MREQPFCTFHSPTHAVQQFGAPVSVGLVARVQFVKLMVLDYRDQVSEQCPDGSGRSNGMPHKR